jgi:hypothetical protein
MTMFGIKQGNSMINWESTHIGGIAHNGCCALEHKEAQESLIVQWNKNAKWYGVTGMAGAR